MEKKEATEKVISSTLKQLEQLYILNSEDFYQYYYEDYSSDIACIKRVIKELQSVSIQHKNKYGKLADFFVAVYTSENCSIKNTLSTLLDIGIEISDKQLRNILTQEGIYKGRGKNND